MTKKLPSSRAAAKDAGVKYYFTGRPCPSGHIAKRSTVKGVCYDCQIASGRNWKRANQERVKKYFREWNKNISSDLAERRRQKKRRRYFLFEKHDPHRKRVRLFHTRKRQKAVKRATPPWVNTEALQQIYLNRPEGHDVDHIIPLQGRIVCGLHVPWNLQYLPMSDNRRKPRIYRHEDNE